MNDELVKYDEMCRSIAECARVDEAKDFRDKAKALEAYYRQVKNRDAERQLAGIRLRAERRAGELLKDIERAKAPNPQGLGGHTGKVVMSDAATQQAASPYAQTLADNGISRQEANQYENLAKVPLKDFEKALASPDKPVAKTIIAAAKSKQQPAPTRRHDPHGDRPKETRAREVIRTLLDAGQPVNVRDLAKELGMSHVLVEQAAAVERAVQKELEERKKDAQVDDPTISLNKRQQALYDRKLRLLEERERQLENLIIHETIKRNREHIEMTWLPGEKQRIKEMEDALSINGLRTPIFTNTEYRLLMSVLHPDNTASKERRSEALRLVISKEIKLRGIDPKEDRLSDRLPQTLEELLARRKGRPLRA